MQRTVVERDDKLENEKLALEKENLRKVMDNFSLSTGLSVVAVNLYGEVFLSGAQYEENTFASIFSPLQRAGSGAGGAMKRRAKRRLSGMNLISSAVMAGW